MASALPPDDPSCETLITWQAIHHACTPDSILYHEAGAARTAAHAPTSDGYIHQHDEGIWTGIGMAAHAIMVLGNCPLVDIGVPLHHEAAMDLGAWQDVEDMLANEPSIAQRLIFQIGGTVSSDSIADIGRFCMRMRRHGCRTALSGFGRADCSIAALVALRPDIVRIDPFFLRYGLIAETGRALLCHLVALASTIARDVTIEGVETERGARLAADTGAMWQQGPLYGNPTVIAPAPSGNPGICRL